MISALIQGTLKRTASRHIGKVPFVVATVRAPTDGNEAAFVDVIAFDDAVCQALLSLSAGEPVALAGTLTAGVWITKEGEPRPQLKMIVNAVLTIASARRKRGAPGAVQTRTEAPASRGRSNGVF
ncbi:MULTISPECIES: single-stranded DNA-binding protein [unclassified Thiomonas]|uniref:single-stranded DNA-binding protein n=1 Tax=unclassified Thiomonas TaxID=2625466 RepID=UPI0012AA7922|nr:MULTISPECIES: single-stranded DNA-binding protein [unclassified Thiomonas]VDY06767.1 conserved protein of unknown function [Thiomonas sp. Bio17B3]VDY09936.1 conserved protein of unknown function [Thiomonas sp. Sup16B3]VDY11180.1 conserved protein of unknown function [Thiomonas sp. Sup16B3]VDY11280.1 conserved protein of unknown function [Thiomonas sp. Bio17B3]VDY15783.1 conserved protein of unknown function [Thiomonas sp. CB2]